jgi:hypothetical protein
MPSIVHLKPSGWAIRYDGTPDCAAEIAKQIWPDVEASSRPQTWTFHHTKLATAWANPGRGRMLVGNMNDWVAFYDSAYRVVRSLPPEWLDGTSLLTRNILDEWMRR